MRQRAFAALITPVTLATLAFGAAVACTAGTGTPPPLPSNRREPPGPSQDPPGSSGEPAASPVNEPPGASGETPVGGPQPSGAPCPACSGTYTCTANGVSVVVSPTNVNGVCGLGNNVAVYCIDGIFYAASNDGGLAVVPWTPLPSGGFDLGSGQFVCVPGGSSPPGGVSSGFDAG
jgi:hypothetical protein